MPTKKTILTFVVEEDLEKLIDDFRYENRIPNRSDAIRHLIREGLEKYNIEPPPAQLARSKKPKKSRKK